MLGGCKDVLYTLQSNSIRAKIRVKSFVFHITQKNRPKIPFVHQGCAPRENKSCSEKECYLRTSPWLTSAEVKRLVTQSLRVFLSYGILFFHIKPLAVVQEVGTQTRGGHLDQRWVPSPQVGTQTRGGHLVHRWVPRPEVGTQSTGEHLDQRWAPSPQVSTKPEVGTQTRGGHIDQKWAPFPQVGTQTRGGHLDQRWAPRPEVATQTRGGHLVHRWVPRPEVGTQSIGGHLDQRWPPRPEVGTQSTGRHLDQRWVPRPEVGNQTRGGHLVHRWEPRPEVGTWSIGGHLDQTWAPRPEVATQTRGGYLDQRWVPSPQVGTQTKIGHFLYFLDALIIGVFTKASCAAQNFPHCCTIALLFCANLKNLFLPLSDRVECKIKYMSLMKPGVRRGGEGFYLHLTDEERLLWVRW